MQQHQEAPLILSDKAWYIETASESHIKTEGKAYSNYQPTKTLTFTLSKTFTWTQWRRARITCVFFFMLISCLGVGCHNNVKNKLHTRTTTYGSLTLFNPSLSPCSPLSCFFIITSYYSSVPHALFSSTPPPLFSHLILSLFHPSVIFIIHFISTWSWSLTWLG